MPLPFIVDPEETSATNWEAAQEQNVAYVAVTRAKSELLFLKHIKKLLDAPERIVELFGEEAADAEDERWWDEE